MAPPDARPDVTARIAAADKLIERSGWSINEDDDIDDARALLADLARRLTEQEAEIARLREQKDVIARDRDSCMVDFGALSRQRDKWKDAATAAEQALTAARRERDEARRLLTVASRVAAAAGEKE